MLSSAARPFTPHSRGTRRPGSARSAAARARPCRAEIRGVVVAPRRSARDRALVPFAVSRVTRRRLTPHRRPGRRCSSHRDRADHAGGPGWHRRARRPGRTLRPGRPGRQLTRREVDAEQRPVRHLRRVDRAVSDLRIRDRAGPKLSRPHAVSCQLADGRNARSSERDEKRKTRHDHRRRGSPVREVSHDSPFAGMHASQANRASGRSRRL